MEPCVGVMWPVWTSGSVYVGRLGLYGFNRLTLYCLDQPHVFTVEHLPVDWTDPYRTGPDRPGSGSRAVHLFRGVHRKWDLFPVAVALRRRSPLRSRLRSRFSSLLVSGVFIDTNLFSSGSIRHYATLYILRRRVLSDTLVLIIISNVLFLCECFLFLVRNVFFV